MKTKRALEITIETHESTTIRIRERQASTLFCGSCHKNTTHLTFAGAASAFGLSMPGILDLARTGQIHFADAENEGLLICTNSLTPKSWTGSTNKTSEKEKW